MASIDWPATLPQTLQRDGLSTKDQSAVVRTDMDTGPAKVRLRFTAAVENIKGNILLTEEQLAIFQTFFRTTTKRGTLRFNMLHPVSCQTKEFRFKGEPDINPSSEGHFIASLELEVLP